MAEAGALIGPYRLLSRLGKGAMGDVWRARDERLDRYVAVKLLPPDLARDPERRARMLREARAAAGVGHANVVTLYDIVADGDTDVLVMELVDGATLSETIRKQGPPTARAAIEWLIGIADALAAAHAKGILHRDMKSANVMLTAAGQIKVLDFGLAKLRDDAAPAPAAAPPAAGDAPPARASTDHVATLPDAADVALDATMASEPDAKQPAPAPADVALDATMGSEPAAATSSSRSRSFASDRYETRAGALLGTPMYMAPEQIAGAPPDERSEVFSVGVIAYELCTGKPPYSARTMDELFAQITHEPAPPLPDKVPAPLAAVVAKALAKDPAQRYAKMSDLRAALVKVRDALFTPARWPYVVAAVALAGAAAGLALLLGRTHTVPDRPGDAYVRQALHDYDVFQGDQALGALRSALRIAPEHARALAYTILFGGPADDRAAAAATAEKIAGTADGKDRVLLETAIALERRGPRAARAEIAGSALPKDRELAFWAAEMAYRAGDYDAAGAEYARLLGDPEPSFRGRIYDHDSSVLLYLDRPAEALAIGKLYRDAYPAEADAIAVYATTLAAAGRLDEAIAAAEDARRLAEGEDTLAGLGKVYAWKGDLAKAIELYTQSVQRAGDARRPIRRAALAWLQAIHGDLDAARATVAPCLPGGADAAIHERAQCLFVAGLVDRAHTHDAEAALDALAAEATDVRPAYGQPASLAGLLRATGSFFGGGCVRRDEALAPPVPATAPIARPEVQREVAAAYAAPRDFYATYHVPFFLTYADCEAAALAAYQGDRARAVKILEPHARAPGRWWIEETIARYRAAPR